MSTEIKRLYRSRSERMLGGVCGGLGEYLNIDPTIVRIIFIFAGLLGGPGVIAYIVMLLIIPEEPIPGEAVITTTAEPVETPPAEE